ncbi:MAG: hypothetical protein OEQ39_22230 [Gammaproteobacteria bacterium]|nr:hypothetical protein [Gammaproteobacteria bacterium]MDH3468704.1 hypothetical protein [Gammaproteobacteria bacterium]
MWNPFKSKPLLEEDDELFQVKTYRWLLTHFGGQHFYEDTQLILPTEEYFPSKVNSPEEAAQETFEKVKSYAGLEKWPCTLQIQEEDPNLVVGETLIVQNVEHNPHGTFSVNEKDEAIITYTPKLAANPTQMVATFAHELAHYLTSTATEPPPGSWDNWEFATDIAATFLGFGIFQANSVFNFQQYSSAGTIGWQTTGGGYLSESEHSYSLGIFLTLKGIPPDIAYPHCDGNIKAFLKKALKELEEKSHINDLRKVKYIETNS